MVKSIPLTILSCTAIKWSAIGTSVNFDLPQAGGQGLKILVIAGILVIVIGFLLKAHRPYKPKRSQKHEPTDSDTDSKY
jgi:LPXTG-motif cell wall-anchored protein